MFALTVQATSVRVLPFTSWGAVLLNQNPCMCVPRAVSAGRHWPDGWNEGMQSRALSDAILQNFIAIHIFSWLHILVDLAHSICYLSPLHQ